MGARGHTSWLVDFHPFCVFLCSRFISCDRTWLTATKNAVVERRRLNFRVRVFLKSAVKFSKKLLHYEKVTVSCPINMSPELFFQALHQTLQTTKINLKKTVSLILFSKITVAIRFNLSIHASFYFIFAVLYPLFMFWLVMFMFHSVWCQFLLQSLTL